jgi:hypothetical protein
MTQTRAAPATLLGRATAADLAWALRTYHGEGGR